MKTGFYGFLMICLLLVQTSVMPRGAVALESLAVEFSGCGYVLHGPVCVITDEDTVAVWVDTLSAAAVTVLVDNKAAAITSTKAVQNGTLFVIGLPQQLSILRIEAGARRWSLRLQRETVPAVIGHARALNKTGQPAESGRYIAAELESLPADWRGVGLRMIGQSQRNAGDTAAAIDSLQAAIVNDTRLGRRSDAIRSATVLAFLWLEHGREYSKARELLQSMQPVPHGDAQSHYFLQYYLGLTAYNAGDARMALRYLSRAADQAARMDRAALRSYAESILAVQLQQIGRRDLAQQLLAAWVDNLPDNVSPCDRALHLTNLGWARLLMLEAGEQTDNPASLLQEAYDASLQHCRSADRINGLTNLALASLHAGDTTVAAAYITRARRESDLPRLRTMLWLIDIEARVALAQGDTSRALALFMELDTLADATLSPTARWRAAVGKALVLQAMSNMAAALESFAVADKIVDEDIYLVPLDAGRETLLTSRDWATKQHLALLLDNGLQEQAFRLARHARNRALRSVSVSDRIAALTDEEKRRWELAVTRYHDLRKEIEDSVRNAWTLAADDLARLNDINRSRARELREIVDIATTAIRAPAIAQQPDPVPGELMVAFHPLPGGWAVFSHDGVRLTVHRPDCTDRQDDALAQCLISPVAEAINAASVLQILPFGELNQVDFASVVLAGVPIIEMLPLVYSIDLPKDKSRVLTTGQALLVADPVGDLAAARAEINAVLKTLDGTRGWQSQVYVGDAASASRVIQELGTADLFHFAGHARFIGELGWDSELKLAGGTSLDVTDIITLESVPDLVVLSGCETARTADRLRTESIGLANAFLVAGAQSVVATSRPVRDDVARVVIEVFYQAWMAGQPAHNALRIAQLALRDTRPDADWAAFRIIER